MNPKIKIALWIALALSVIGILVLAKQERENRESKPAIIAVSIENGFAFITKDEINSRLQRMQLIYPGQKVSEINISAIEDSMRKMPEIEQVEVFKKMSNNWEMNVKVREPFARIFNLIGDSFYLDKYGKKMSTSPNFSARILVISGNISDLNDTLCVDDIINNKLLKSSNCLDQIYRISKYVCNDPFLASQISQVHRNQWGDFILIPQVGCQEIIFGSAFTDEEVKEKMNKLKTFYKEGIAYQGWDTYNTINLKFKNQVVCKKRIKDESEGEI